MYVGLHCGPKCSSTNPDNTKDLEEGLRYQFTTTQNFPKPQSNTVLFGQNKTIICLFKQAPSYVSTSLTEVHLRVSAHGRRKFFKKARKTRHKSHGKLNPSSFLNFFPPFDDDLVLQLQMTTWISWVYFTLFSNYNYK